MSYQSNVDPRFGPQPQVILPQPPACSTGHVVVAWVLAVATGLYLLPWAIAATRGKRNVGAIALINIFLGWTLAGWIAALVMACLNDDRKPAVVITQAPAGPGYLPGPLYGQAFAPPSLPPAPLIFPEPVRPSFHYGPLDPHPPAALPRSQPTAPYPVPPTYSAPTNSAPSYSADEPTQVLDPLPSFDQPDRRREG